MQRSCVCFYLHAFWYFTLFVPFGSAPRNHTLNVVVVVEVARRSSGEPYSWTTETRQCPPIQCSYTYTILSVSRLSRTLHRRPWFCFGVRCSSWLCFVVRSRPMVSPNLSHTCMSVYTFIYMCIYSYNLYLMVSPSGSFVELELEGLARTPHVAPGDRGYREHAFILSQLMLWVVVSEWSRYSTFLVQGHRPHRSMFEN